MKKLASTAIVFAIATLSAVAAQSGVATTGSTEVYKIDPVHSSVKFSIRHFVSKVTGNFDEFEGTITVDRDNLVNSSAEAVIRVPSVDTDSAKRDAHLQTDDFFDATQYPLMTFQSTKWESGEDENHFKVTGDLNIHGVTKAVTLDVELLGFGEGMQGAYLSGWEARTTLDRTEWGVNGAQPVVGNEVEVTINIEADRQ